MKTVTKIFFFLFNFRNQKVVLSSYFLLILSPTLIEADGFFKVLPGSIEYNLDNPYTESLIATNEGKEKIRLYIEPAYYTPSSRYIELGKRLITAELKSQLRTKLESLSKKDFPGPRKDLNREEIIQNIETLYLAYLEQKIRHESDFNSTLMNNFQNLFKIYLRNELSNASLPFEKQDALFELFQLVVIKTIERFGMESLAPFVRWSPKVVSLKPGESRTIRVSVKTAKKLPDGDYRAHLLFKMIQGKKSNFDLLEGADVNLNLNLQLNLEIAVLLRGRKGTGKADLKWDCVLNKNKQIQLILQNSTVWREDGWLSIFDSKRKLLEPARRFISLRETRQVINTDLTAAGGELELVWKPLKKNSPDAGRQRCLLKRAPKL